MTNQQEKDITRRMSENIAGKFSYLASQLPGMKVKNLHGLQFVDCGRQSDTFNTVLGTPAS
ncbi:GNAT family N-acetyltransferase, partial [Erwinia amylovora]|nr:GNAT family N-acetyltransferase [Erwinia amylovora]